MSIQILREGHLKYLSKNSFHGGTLVALPAKVRSRKSKGGRV